MSQGKSTTKKLLDPAEKKRKQLQWFKVMIAYLSFG